MPALQAELVLRRCPEPYLSLSTAPNPMWSKLTAVFNLALGCLLLAGIGWGGYIAVASSLKVLRSFESDVAVAIVAAAGTIVVSALTLAVTKRYERAAAVRQELRAKKVPVYEDLIGTIFKILHSEKLPEARMTEEEIVRFFVRSTEQMVIWGSDEVVRSYREFRTTLVSAQADPDRLAQGMLLFENLMLAIRKDLGHSNRDMRPGTLLGLWVNDIDQVLGPGSDIPSIRKQFAS